MSRWRCRLAWALRQRRLLYALLIRRGYYRPQPGGRFLLIVAGAALAWESSCGC
jgi:hypothetical protein